LARSKTKSDLEDNGRLKKQWDYFIKIAPVLKALLPQFGPKGWLPIELVVRWDCWRFDGKPPDPIVDCAAVCFFSTKTQRYRIEFHPALTRTDFPEEEFLCYFGHELGHILLGHVSPDNPLSEEVFLIPWHKRKIEIEAECFPIYLFGEEFWKKGTAQNKAWRTKVLKRFKKIFIPRAVPLLPLSF